ncbi:MAG TPA: endo-1,4-beta-xylanase [Tepidisphaeraceae bacterium]|nr:endo-1,4-beta-xylanase [Tepidisphaeraceae bacterium]
MSIKFEIYRDGRRLTEFVPIAPIATGPESVPIPADIRFQDGLLVLNRNDDQAIGVSLLWDVPPVGSFHLETTRLQPRERPYNLNVELARFRLMKIVQKQEDWNLFDFPKAERFVARFREAQALFADALGKLHIPIEAARLCDESLAIAIDLSEQLAMFQSELLINRRRAGNTFVRHIFGCRVDPAVQNARYKETLSSSFDYAVLPMSWKFIQPQEGAFNTDPIDDWVELLSRKRMPIVGGPLIDLTDGHVPDWMYIWEHDFDTLRELAYEYVQKIVGRYRKAVAVWNVAAGLQTNQVFTLNFDQIIELTRLLVSQVKTLIPNAKTLVTIKHPFGEFCPRGRASIPPMLYAEMAAQSGINFEAFGLELQMGVPSPGLYTRDLFQISCMLDRFSTMGRPVFLTAAGVPGRPTPDPTDRSEGKLDPMQAGHWRRPWDPELQAEWMSNAYRIALSRPYVESVAWSDLADMSPTLPAGGLLDDMLRPKPAFTRLTELRELFKPHGRK